MFFQNRKKSWKSSKNIFRDQKNFEKKNHRKVNENSKFLIFDFFFSKKSKFWNFELSLTFRWFFFLENFLVSKNFFSDFFKIFFDFEKFYFIFGKNILKSKICSGVQKSYLENRTSIIKLFKIKKPIILTQITGFPYGVTYTDP